MCMVRGYGSRGAVDLGLFASQLGVVPAPVVQVPLTLASIPTAMLLVNLVAALRGCAAVRLTPATVLRAE